MEYSKIFTLLSNSRKKNTTMEVSKAQINFTNVQNHLAKKLEHLHSLFWLFGRGLLSTWKLFYDTLYRSKAMAILVQIDTLWNISIEPVVGNGFMIWYGWDSYGLQLCRQLNRWFFWRLFTFKSFMLIFKRVHNFMAH